MVWHPRLRVGTRHFGVQARMRKMITKNEVEERLIPANCYWFLGNLVEKVAALEMNVTHNVSLKNGTCPYFQQPNKERRDTID